LDFLDIDSNQHGKLIDARNRPFSAWDACVQCCLFATLGTDWAPLPNVD
jgi:hypothetical protein